MKKTTWIAGSLLLSLALSACGDAKNASNPGNAATDAAVNLDAIIAQKSGDPTASGGNTCLLDYATRYDQLLTKEMVLAATGLPEEKMKVIIHNTSKSPSNHDVVYSFPMGRKQKMIGVKGEMVMPDEVILRGIKAKSPADFEKSYRALNAEEEQAFEDAKKEVISGNNADANAALAQSNVDKKTVEKGMNQMGSVFSQVAQSYIVVDGLGDAARWNTLTNEMVVLQDGVQFEIVANISDENDRNRSVATDLAKQVLSRCE